MITPGGSPACPQCGSVYGLGWYGPESPHVCAPTKPEETYLEDE